MFGLFGSKQKSSSGQSSEDVASLLAGYLCTKTCKLMGHEFSPEVYDKLAKSAVGPMQIALVPLLNRAKQQEVYDVLSEIAGDRTDELYGHYVVQLWVRWTLILNAHANGKVSAKEFSLDLISDVLFRDMKKIIEQFKQ